MNSNSTKVITSTALMALALALAGCSQSNEQISQQKHDIDAQRDGQQKMVDKRSSELKSSIEKQADQAKRQLEADKKTGGVNKTRIADAERAIERRADLMKKKVDFQTEACKKQVDWNADVAKEQIDENFDKIKIKNKD